MSIVRHGGPLHTQNRSGEPVRRRQEIDGGREARRRTVMKQDARRCAARAAVRGGWTPAEAPGELREVLDMLGLLIDPASMKRLLTMERRVREGVEYKPGKYGRPVGTADRPRGMRDEP